MFKDINCNLCKESKNINLDSVSGLNNYISKYIYETYLSFKFSPQILVAACSSKY